MHILFLVPYPHGKAPSQRFRFEQYLSHLKERGFTYDFQPFISDETWDILYKPEHFLRKALGISYGFMRRFVNLRDAMKADYVFIHREASPIGPPIFEWIISKILKRRIIYDFDDAIWIPNTSGANKIVANIKWHGKIANICKWSYKVSCGNSYLQKYASAFNKAAVVNPTTIDTINLHNQVNDQCIRVKPVIGWTGTHSTVKYIDQIVPILAKLEREFDFEFRVISNQPLTLNLKSMVYKKWSKNTEIQDLLEFNIGLMPLEDDAWAKGKCAFKALQYMALGEPALVSPVGMNTEVVTQGVNGFICSTAPEWEAALRILLNDKELRSRMGNDARRTIEQNYSVVANLDNFLKLFT